MSKKTESPICAECKWVLEAHDTDDLLCARPGAPKERDVVTGATSYSSCAEQRKEWSVWWRIAFRLTNTKLCGPNGRYFEPESDEDDETDDE